MDSRRTHTPALYIHIRIFRLRGSIFLPVFVENEFICGGSYLSELLHPITWEG